MKQSKSLRVLVIRNAYQQDAGGAEQYALNLAIALKAAGHKPILVTKVNKIDKKMKNSWLISIKSNQNIFHYQHFFFFFLSFFLLLFIYLLFFFFFLI